MRKILLGSLLVLVYGGALHILAQTPSNEPLLYDVDGFAINQPAEVVSSDADTPMPEDTPAPQENISIEPKNIKD